MTTEPRRWAFSPLAIKALALVSTVAMLGGIVLLLEERHRLRLELTEEKTNLEEFKDDIATLCEIVGSQELYPLQPTSAVVGSPSLSQVLANGYGKAKLEQLCPSFSETAEPSIQQPS